MERGAPWMVAVVVIQGGDGSEGGVCTCRQSDTQVSISARREIKDGLMFTL
jgi:hypothetical protein